MKNTNDILWIVVILSIAIFFRSWDFKNTPPGLWADEAMNGTNTIQALEGRPPAGGVKIFYPENFGREGFFINIQALFVKALGHEPWVLRLPSAIFGILTVLGLYFMTKELFNERVALFASFFLATSFWHINFSRIGFRAIMAPFFLVWSFYFLLKGISGRRTSIVALAGFLFGLGVHSYIAFRVAPIIALLPLWKFYKDSRAEEAELPLGSSASKCAPCLIVLFVFMAIVAASPLLIYYAKNPADFLGRTSAISIFNQSQPLGQFSENTVKTLQMFNFFGDFNWRHNFRGASQLWWPVGILFLIGIWKALRSSTSPGKKSDFPGKSDFEEGGVFPRNASNFTLLWFVVMLLPVALSSEGLPHALRSIVLIPPAMIFAALGLEAVIMQIKTLLKRWKQQFPKRLFQLSRIEQELKILLFIFFISVTANAFNQYFLRWAPNPNVYDAFLGSETKIAHWLNSEPQNMKKYIVTNSVGHADTDGTPLSFQPIIFITDTYFENKQREKNIYYLGENEFDKIDCSSQCEIIPVESKPDIYAALKQKIPNLRLDASPGFIMLKNQ